jgi:branched-chain amino acid aminotransferase
MVVWFDGALVPIEAARVDPTDRGFTLGDGLFETIRASGGAPRRVAEHLARLARGARLLAIPLPYDDDALAAALDATLAANALHDDAVLRLELTRGPGPRGLLPPRPTRPTVLVSASASPPPAPPASIVVARSTCRNERSPLSQIKALGALDGLLARLEAEGRGADDAVLLSTAGRVAEASASNVFARIAGELVTPPLADGALPGVARAAILAAGLAAERSIDADDLLAADEIVLTNSLGVRAVTRIEGRFVGSGREGPATMTLRASLFSG